MAKHGAGAVVGSGAVLVVAAGFAALALATTASGPGAGAHPLHLRAVFASGDGLAAGDPVLLAGIEVGAVTAIRLDRARFLADVDVSVTAPVAIPSDSRLAVSGGGAGASGALAILPGHSPTPFRDGATVTATVPAESLEQQMGNYIFGSGGVGED